MKKFFLYSALNLWFTIIIGACGAQEPLPAITIAPTPILAPTLTTQHLNVHNIDEMREQILLSSSLSEPIAGVTFADGGREMVLVAAREGDLQRWNLQNRKMEFSNRLRPFGLNSVAFDGNGEMVAISAGSTELAQKMGVAADRTGAEVWSTKQTLLVFETGNGASVKNADVVLSKNGRWLVEITNGYDVYDIVEKKFKTQAVVGAVDFDDNWAEMTTGALDESGEWLAYAFTNGLIGLQAWRYTSNLEESEKYQKRISSYIEDTPLDLAFDPSRSYLAAVMAEHLLMWDLQSQSSKRFRPKKTLEEQHAFSIAGDVVFSPDGQLMAVGTGEKWQIWSVEEGELLKEHPQGSYALAFSPDGRLFAWGDLEGNVHIWGVPE